MKCAFDIFLKALPTVIGGHSSRMPLGFATHHPGGMADNSPTFQRWELNFGERESRRDG